MGTSLVELAKYNFENLPLTGFYEVLGKRGTGKTTWIQYILTQAPMKSDGVFVVMVGSETVRKNWEDLIPSTHIHDACVNTLEHIKNRQNDLIRQFSKANLPFPDSLHVTLVLDDIASNKEIMRSRTIAYLASNSRHLHMRIFILAQYHCQIVSEVRNQFDMIFLLSTSDTKTINRIHAEYCSSLLLHVFKGAIAFVTDNHGLLILDNRLSSSDISKICFHAVIDPYPPARERLGHVDQWKFCSDFYSDPDDDRPTECHAADWKKKYEEIGRCKTIVHKSNVVIIRKAA